MKGNFRVLILLSVVLIALAGCQSSASVSSTEIIAPAPVVIPASPVPAPAPAPAPAAEETAAVAEVPVEAEYTYMGYTMKIAAYDGYALITLPAGLTKADVDAFMAAEVAAYGSMLDGITYSFDSDSVVRISYPQGIGEGERRAYVNMFATDVISMASAVFSIPEGTPVSVTYSYAGYTLSADIADGSTVLTYPDFITSAEAEGFFAAENAAYGDVLGSVFYTITGPGSVTFTYPESVSISDVQAYTALFVTDLINYVEG